MEDYQKPIVNRSFTVENFDGETLLYSEAGTQAVYLNDAAYAVWLLCKENMTTGQMISYLKEVYPNQKKQIGDDVVSALETLQTNGVIEFADEWQS
ncbi:PqqD family protein [Desulforhopalus sp. 52FAK]